MKKLNLNTSVFQKGEVLTRSQLKKVFGGAGSGVCGDGGSQTTYPDFLTCYNCSLPNDLVSGTDEAYIIMDLIANACARDYGSGPMVYP